MNDGLIQINQYHIVYTCYTTWNALPPGLVNLAPICQSDGSSMAPSSERPTLSPQAHSLITLLYLSHPILLAYITSPHWQIQERLYGFVLISSEKGCLFLFLVLHHDTHKTMPEILDMIPNMILGEPETPEEKKLWGMDYHLHTEEDRDVIFFFNKQQ